MQADSAELRARVDDSPMSRMQWSAIVVCVLLNVLDGFDVLVMSYTSAAVSDEWSLSGSQLGLLLSAGLVGMALGSLLLAPTADRVGRRTLILACLVVASAGMLGSALSRDAVQLGLLRMLTGIGVGGILASSNVIAAEYANGRWRGLAVSLNVAGYAVGATVGGVVTMALQSSSGWRAVFVFGGVGTALLIGVVLYRLPESLDFLLTKRSPGALERLNRLLVAMKQPTLESMPDRPDTPAEPAPRTRRILTPRLRRNTLLTWAGFFTAMSAFYFVTSWTPKLLVEAGLSAAQGIAWGVLLNLGGIFGTLVLGLLATRFALQHLLVGYTLTTAALLALFVPAVSVYGSLLALSALIGLFINGSVAGMYTLALSVYPSAIRATGVGWGVGMGRIGSLVSPLVAGGLLDSGWGPGRLYLAAAVVVAAGGLAVHAVRLPSYAPR
ncbi:MFS transporter [Planomonospora parontospora subsp. parontospora]|uniref:MFS transporter n=2 Tax=Planomonospora parontospora TaxID=58119 RepID=A0AA37F5B6_9ACTN|nr:MFS transporter [Planomonospora parontospora]GGK73454.1 MFS transporter [Planomonospora parontospora]GII09399.1 MFS transporter [Planomonospora parontospora subsp. parontospora]